MPDPVHPHFPEQLVESLFDSMADIVYCRKDGEGRYRSVNHAFVDRLEVDHKSQVVGKTAYDFFPAELAAVYAAQDAAVLADGQPVQDQLERITHRDGSMGWFLASKFPVHSRDGRIAGVIGISQDLHTPSDSDLELSNLKSLVDFIKQNLDQPLRVEQLAERVSLSHDQLDRRMKRVFRLSTKKFIVKCRLEEAARRLAGTDQPLADIALACGFSDQSAFSRQFRAATSQTPSRYRRQQAGAAADATGS
jgi:PAS domain S-box-containing protein